MAVARALCAVESVHGVARRFFFFDKAYLKHPKVIPNQVYREILTAAKFWV